MPDDGCGWNCRRGRRSVAPVQKVQKIERKTVTNDGFRADADNAFVSELTSRQLAPERTSTTDAAFRPDRMQKRIARWVSGRKTRAREEGHLPMADERSHLGPVVESTHGEDRRMPPSCGCEQEPGFGRSQTGQFRDREMVPSDDGCGKDCVEICVEDCVGTGPCTTGGVVERWKQTQIDREGNRSTEDGCFERRVWATSQFRQRHTGRGEGPQEDSKRTSTRAASKQRM